MSERPIGSQEVVARNPLALIDELIDTAERLSAQGETNYSIYRYREIISPEQALVLTPKNDTEYVASKWLEDSDQVWRNVQFDQGFRFSKDQPFIADRVSFQADSRIERHRIQLVAETDVPYIAYRFELDFDDYRNLFDKQIMDKRELEVQSSD